MLVYHCDSQVLAQVGEERVLVVGENEIPLSLKVTQSAGAHVD